MAVVDKDSKPHELNVYLIEVHDRQRREDRGYKYPKARHGLGTRRPGEKLWGEGPVGKV